MDMGSGSMTMGSSTMNMGSSTTGMTPTSSAGMSMSTGMAMGSMDGMDMGAGACKISMIWNWDTIDTCFLSRSWHVTSHGMFAGSCIGVICLVIILELLRRVQREYDSFLSSKAKTGAAVRNGLFARNTDASSEERSSGSGSSLEQNKSGVNVTSRGLIGGKMGIVRPTLLQQAARATIHMLQFAVAYFVMLLAMYYNGYIIICIFIGAWIGWFIFSWDQLNSCAQGGETEATGCCG